MRRIIAAALASGIAIAGILSTPVKADHTQSSPEGPVVWSPGTRSVRLLDSTSDGVRALGVVDEAAANWSRGQDEIAYDVRPASNTLEVRAGCSMPDSGEIRICSADYGKTGWAGHFDWNLVDGYMRKGRIRINTNYMDGQADGEPAFGDGTVRSEYLYTICHELGHGLGLGHRGSQLDSRGEPGTCMSYDKVSPRPDRHDYEQLETIYGP